MFDIYLTYPSSHVKCKPTLPVTEPKRSNGSSRSHAPSTPRGEHKKSDVELGLPAGGGGSARSFGGTLRSDFDSKRSVPHSDTSLSFRRANNLVNIGRVSFLFKPCFVVPIR